MTDNITDVPIDMILDEVTRFARRRVAPFAARHECPIAPETMALLTREAAQLGILAEDDGGGTGLWEDAASTSGRRMSVGALRVLSEANTGFAWHLHQRALALWLARRLDVDGRQLIVATQGRYGLARHALARYLQGEEASGEDRRMLDDCFGSESGMRLMLAAEPWRQVLLPVWEGDVGMQWVCADRDAVVADSHGRLHGLDEVVGVALRPRRAAWAWHSDLAPEPARAVLCTVLSLQALGQIALAQGALRRGFDLASDYAAARRQGGAAIREHPAVQALLGTARSTLAETDAWLDRLVELEPGKPENLCTIHLARSSLHPAICEAANACLQVLGGSGYMRDAGMEKVVRDSNVLRLLNGTPTELRIFAAAFPTAHRAVA